MVQRENACALPGVNIKYDNFLTCMWRAVDRGYVKRCHAEFCAEGLRHGFTCGVDPTQLRGRRYYGNYPTAVENRSAVSTAIQKRVDAGKTLALGAWDGAMRSRLKDLYTDCIKFPLGAVPKALEPGVFRPFSDHTKTGLNASTCMDMLRHALTTYRDIAEYLKRGYFMRVTDVDNAFPMLPIHPDLWRFFLFSFWASDTDEHETLFMHLTGDFGTRGMPGTFKIFFVDVVVQMARSELVLTLPFVIYVDDCGAIGACQEQTNAEMLAFHEWAEETCGVKFKAIKDKPAAQRQLMLGFWWDSNTLTRTLEERKLTAYIEELTEFAGRGSLTLAELQSIEGKAQRAIMTMPPGAACLCANMFAMARGLKLPWQRRRTNAAVRQDFEDLAELLQLNLGKGYYSYADFGTAPGVWSDASKSKAYTGGGFVSECGRYSFWKYGTSAKRKPIDFLEGDTALHTAELLGARWRKCVVPFGIDNTAFKGAADKGWSAAARLQELVTKLFHMQIQGDYILQFFWLASEDNELADHVSRDREAEFLRAAAGSLGNVTLQRLAGAGQVRQLGEGYSSNNLRDGPATGSLVIKASVTYKRASLYAGLPEELHERLCEVMDNRLRPSSMRTVHSAEVHWKKVCDTHGWPYLLPTDFDGRGGRLAAFVLYLTDDTELVYSSIDSYVWGLVNWQKLQGQPDPRLGVENWTDFMMSVKVLTHVPHEPRKEIPLEYIRKALELVNRDVLWEVQAAFWMLTNLFSFARSESSCPKNYTGEESFDKKFHWQNKDVRGDRREGKLCIKLNQKANKVDPRLERPEAAGGDWVYLGDVEGTVFSIVTWFNLLVQLGGEREPEAPFFRDRDGVRAYRYKDAVSDMRTLLGRVEVEGGFLDASVYGAHGLRVAGYNLSKAGVGVDLTVAHGGWQSAAHDRYERFKMAKILEIPARMVGQLPPVATAEGEEATDRPAQPAERTIGRREVRRGDTEQPAAEGAGGEAPAPAAAVGTPTVKIRPRGRAPNNEFGPGQKEWDGVDGCWREAHAEDASGSGADDEEDAEDRALSAAETPPPAGLGRLSLPTHHPPRAAGTGLHFVAIGGGTATSNAPTSPAHLSMNRS